MKLKYFKREDMLKAILILIVFYLAVLSITDFYLNKAGKEFLKFADMVLDDNLKNQVKSSGKTFYLVDMQLQTYLNGSPDYPIWTPLYADEDAINGHIQRKRLDVVMTANYNKMEADKLAADKEKGEA